MPDWYSVDCLRCHDEWIDASCRSRFHYDDGSIDYVCEDCMTSEEKEMFKKRHVVYCREGFCEICSKVYDRTWSVWDGGKRKDRSCFECLSKEDKKIAVVGELSRR